MTLQVGKEMLCANVVTSGISWTLANCPHSTQRSCAQIIVLRSAEQQFESAAATLNRRAAALYLNVQHRNGGARETSAEGNGASDAAEKHEALYRACRTAVDTAVQAVIEVSAIPADPPNSCNAGNQDHCLQRCVPTSRVHAARNCCGPQTMALPLHRL